jgi:hypothetical protein
MCVATPTPVRPRRNLIHQTAQYLSAFAGSQLGSTKARRNKRNLSIERETMKTSYSRKQITVAVACALALGIAAGAARAQSLSPNQREAWTEGTKAQIWKNGYGECWHSAFGPPPSYNECNPAPVAQYIAPPPPAPAPAPVYVAPPPPPPAAAPEVLPPRKPRG